MTGRRGPWFRDPRVALALGLAAAGAAWFCLYDAYEGRGQRTPGPLRPFTWW